MYLVNCVYSNGVMETLSHAETAAKACEDMQAYKKQGRLYMGKEAVLFWYQKEDAEIPEYINRTRDYLREKEEERFF